MQDPDPGDRWKNGHEAKDCPMKTNIQKFGDAHPHWVHGPCTPHDVDGRSTGIRGKESEPEIHEVTTLTYHMPVYVNCTGHGNYGDGGLYEKRTDITAVPGKDDIVIPFVFHVANHNPADGPAWAVHRRWWLADGTVVAELQKLYIDAQDPLLKDLEHRGRMGQGYVRLWNTSLDPDPIPLMEDQGWVKL